MLFGRVWSNVNIIFNCDTSHRDTVALEYILLYAIAWK